MLKRALFVKFSRNFHDKVRDGGRHFMPPEVRLANLSRMPGFPVMVPRCLFADIEGTSRSGLIIRECIAFGQGAIEPHHPKCLDHLHANRRWTETSSSSTWNCTS